MRVPRRHRFRCRAPADELFRRLPGGCRFRMGTGAGGPQTFGASPVAIVTGEGGPGVPKDALRSVLPRVPDAARSTFPGGAIGCLSYERGYEVEELPSDRRPAPGPDAWFGVYDTFATTIPATGEVEVVSWGLTGEGVFDGPLALSRAENLEEALRAASGVAGAHVPPPGSSPPLAPSPPAPTRIRRPAGRPGGHVRASLDATAHARGTGKILDAIRRGDVYQANLTVRFDVATDVDPVTLFERLLRDNPAPYSLLLETDRGTVISCSPERLLAARGRTVETRPIKGTSPRHSDPGRDAALAAELLASAKNRAELLMITDLLRNDLGKVCEPGSVRVPALVSLESFPHLHHLVSTITGRLRPGRDVLDALEAVFPCGSVVGAPKRRAMEILRDLEPVPRGIYTGTVGWVGFDRSADFAVAIRTGTLAEGVFSFGSGGGIVADSESVSEWHELLLKARAFALALGVDLEGATGGRDS